MLNSAVVVGTSSFSFSFRSVSVLSICCSWRTRLPFAKGNYLRLVRSCSNSAAVSLYVFDPYPNQISTRSPPWRDQTTPTLIYLSCAYIPLLRPRQARTAAPLAGRGPCEVVPRAPDARLPAPAALPPMPPAPLLPSEADLPGLPPLGALTLLCFTCAATLFSLSRAGPAATSPSSPP